jgi:hypothetical protein
VVPLKDFISVELIKMRDGLGRLTHSWCRNHLDIPLLSRYCFGGLKEFNSNQEYLSGH